MSLPRTRLEGSLRIDNKTWLIEPSEAHHLLNVRRCRNGQKIEALIEGRLFILRLEIKDGKLLGYVEEEKKAPPKRELWVLLGLTKTEAFELALRQVTECGATAIVPLHCERSVVKIEGNRLEAKMRRWKLILSEATKQARAFSIPELFPVIKVKDIDALSLPAFKYGAFLGRGSIDLLDCAPKDKAAIAIGPEGDWSETEMQMLEDFGFKPVRLGARIMRAPTAAAVGTAILSMLLEKGWSNAL